MTATTTAPATGKTATASLPFPIASRISTRPAFDTGAVALGAAALTTFAPIAIPAVGYLQKIRLECTLTLTGASALTADAPFNVLQSVRLTTASGNDLIVPVTGYQLYLVNKYGGFSIFSDSRVGRQYAATTAGAHFFLDIPFEFDPETGLGSIPAMASNRSYMLNLTAAALTTTGTGATAGTLRVTGMSYFWSEPPSVTQSGVSQETVPAALGTISQWQLEQTSLTPGDKLVRLNNVGNVNRTHIFVLRNSSGARIDTNGWPASGQGAELYLDNEMLLSLPMNLWEQQMCEWFPDFISSAKDVANGLDTGVYALPWHTFAGSRSGAVGNTRAQLLPTLDSSLLQLRANWGSAVSTLEVLTNSVIPAKSSGFRAIFNK